MVTWRSFSCEFRMRNYQNQMVTQYRFGLKLCNRSFVVRRNYKEMHDSMLELLPRALSSACPAVATGWQEREISHLDLVGATL